MEIEWGCGASAWGCDEVGFAVEGERVYEQEDVRRYLRWLRWGC